MIVADTCLPLSCVVHMRQKKKYNKTIVADTSLPCGRYVSTSLMCCAYAPKIKINVADARLP